MNGIGSEALDVIRDIYNGKFTEEELEVILVKTLCQLSKTLSNYGWGYRKTLLYSMFTDEFAHLVIGDMTQLERDGVDFDSELRKDVIHMENNEL